VDNSHENTATIAHEEENRQASCQEVPCCFSPVLFFLSFFIRNREENSFCANKTEYLQMLPYLQNIVSRESAIRSFTTSIFDDEKILAIFSHHQK
jgi:hypothetical protein